VALVKGGSSTDNRLAACFRAVVAFQFSKNSSDD